MMQSDAHWLLLLIGAGVTLLSCGSLLHAVLRRAKVRRRTLCPKSGAPVTVTFLRDDRSGRFTGVRGCSAFDDPTDVRCGKTCVELENRKVRSDR